MQEPPIWSASVPSMSARCSVQNWPIGRMPVDAPAGRTVRVCSVRLVSFTHRPVAAICYEVEPVDGPARITVQSELTGADPGWPRRSKDPIARRVPRLASTVCFRDLGGVLTTRRHRNGRGAGAQDQAKRAAGRRSMDRLVDCPAPVRAESRSFADGGLVTAATMLAPGQKLRVIKFGVEVPGDASPGIRWVPASKATPPRASASRSPRGQWGHVNVARMSSRSPRYSPAQPTRPGQ